MPADLCGRSRRCTPRGFARCRRAPGRRPDSESAAGARLAESPAGLANFGLVGPKLLCPMVVRERFSCQRRARGGVIKIDFGQPRWHVSQAERVEQHGPGCSAITACGRRSYRSQFQQFDVFVDQQGFYREQRCSAGRRCGRQVARWPDQIRHGERPLEATRQHRGQVAERAAGCRLAIFDLADRALAVAGPPRELLLRQASFAAQSRRTSRHRVTRVRAACG